MVVRSLRVLVCPIRSIRAGRRWCRRSFYIYVEFFSFRRDNNDRAAAFDGANSIVRRIELLVRERGKREGEGERWERGKRERGMREREKRERARESEGETAFYIREWMGENLIAVARAFFCWSILSLPPCDARDWWQAGGSLFCSQRSFNKF